MKAEFLDKYDKYLPKKGKPILEWDKDEFYFSTIRDYAFNFTDILRNNADWLLMSNPLKEKLEKSGINGVQFLEVTIDSDVPEFCPYWFANVFCMEGALNWDKSEYTTIGTPPQIASLKKVVLNCTQIKKVDIFRLPEFFPSIYVSEKFKTLFESNSFSGAKFQKTPCT